MLPDKQTNSNPAKQSSTFMGTLQDKLKDIKNFSNWSAKEQMVAVTAVGVIFGALLPVVAVALPVAATGAAVALILFFAVKAVEYGYKGLKWSAEETWEGAKRVGGKIRDGVVYIKGKAKKGASTAADRLGDSLKRAAHGDEYSMESEFVQESLERRGIRKVVNDTINHVKANDSSVPSVIKSAIDSKIGELGSADEESNLKEKGNLEKQRKIVDRLEEILTKSPLDTKELSLITEVFSQYQSEVKGILDDYAQNPKNYPKPPTLSQRMSNSLLPSFSSLGRKSPDNLSRSSSMSSLNSASSTVGLLTGEHKEVKAPISLWNRLSSPFKSSKKSEQPSGAGYQPLSEPDAMPSATVNHNNLSRSPSSSSLYDGSPVVPPEAPEGPISSRDSGINSPNPSGSSTPPKIFKPPVPPKPLAVNLAEANKRKKQQTPSTSRSDFSDSGINSDFSTPTGRQSSAHMMLTEKDGSMKKQAHLKKTGRLDELVGQPSTEIDVDTDVQHKTAPNFVA